MPRSGYSALHGVILRFKKVVKPKAYLEASRTPTMGFFLQK